MNTKMMALALMTLAGSAMAQPAVFTDLGNRASTQTFTQPVTAAGVGDIQWFRIVLPPATAGAGYVDIWTTPTANPTPATDMTDTEIGLYDNAGNGASTGWNDDDDGPGLYSALSYGSTTSRGATVYPGQTNGAARNGRDGALAGGVYWLAAARYNVDWTTGFGATSTATSTQTTTLLNFDIFVPTDPFPPTGAGAATPASAEPGASVLYTVTVTPGGNPASTGITVTGNLSAVGGASSVAFHDDGANGDVSAGDGIYSFQYSIPAGTAGGNYVIPVTVADAQARSSNFNLNGNVFNPLDLGTLVDNVTVSQTADLAAGEVKWYKATIADCTAAAQRQLTITTEHSGAGDSELGAYAADGTLLISVDDVVGAFAKLTFGYQGTNGDAPAGTYFIALGSFNTTFATPFVATSTGPAASFLLEVTQKNDFPPDVGETLETADVPAGSGALSSITGAFDYTNDVDMYKISICDAANFSATTYQGTTADTRLFLFNADGMGVSFNDDVPTGSPGDDTLQSLITGVNVPSNGDYYLAVTRYAIMASDAGAANIWHTGTPFDVEITPDGAGAGNPLGSWTGASVGTGSVDYTIALTGACYPSSGPSQCSPADVGVAGGSFGHDRLLNNNDFISFITLFFNQDAAADLGMAGGQPGSDSQWNNNDFIAFINYFFNDAANCNG